MNSSEWHLITSEYPPLPGGVSDYTRLIAMELAAAGDAVHVWCPPADGADGETPGVLVHREMGRMSPADLRRVGHLLDQFKAPRRVLVQWVPHGYGYNSMNLPFCIWLWQRASLKRDHVELMVHEPFLTFDEGTWKQSGVAAVHRLMTTVLLNAARRIWLSIPAWEDFLRPYALGRRVPFTWLPVASNIPVLDDPIGARAVRDRYARDGELVIGHFGTYGQHVTNLLMTALPALMNGSVNRVLLLLGRGGEALRDELVRGHPELAERVHASGALCATDLSRHVSTCDVMIQPYPDGISSRRTSAMVGLSHGLPLVTTSGYLTESFWARSGAVALAPVADAAALATLTERLLADANARSRMSVAARVLYEERFDVQKTIATLRGATI